MNELTVKYDCGALDGILIPQKADAMSSCSRHTTWLSHNEPGPREQLRHARRLPLHTRADRHHRETCIATGSTRTIVLEDRQILFSG